MIEDTEEVTVGKKLFDIFNEGTNLIEEVENSSLSFNSPEYQGKIKKCVELLEDATRLVSLVGMFSSNENVEEISTENLQFLLLPYFLGQVVQKLQNASRQEILNASKVYFNDFIKRCEDYEIVPREKDDRVEQTSRNAPEARDSLQQLLQSANQRNAKIEQYRKMKELEEQISSLKLAAKNKQVDDEIKRKLYINQLQHGVIKAKEEICSIEQELQMLEYRKSLMETNNHNKDKQNSSAGNMHNHRPDRRSNTPLKPIIIAKDVAQKAVFGMGYPSLPVMTVGEFYEQRVQQGDFPSQEQVKEMNAKMLKQTTEPTEDEKDKEDIDQAEQDRLQDDDDEEYLARMRAKDEYKDVVRRGDGNRYNRS